MKPTTYRFSVNRVNKNRLAFALFLLAATLSTTPAKAQITYDEVNSAYFVSGDVEIDDYITGNDIFVGKDNATNFNTLAGPFTFTVGINGAISNFGNYYPVGSSHPKYYAGLNVFGNNKAILDGCEFSYASTYDASTLTVDGAFGSIVEAYNASTINLKSGMVANVYAYDTSTINVAREYPSDNFAIIYPTSVAGYDKSIVNISGRVDFVSGSDNSTINLGGAFYAIADNHSTLNVSGFVGDFGFGEDEGALVGAGSSTVNLDGGMAIWGYGYDNSTINIKDAIVYNLRVHDTSTTNILSGSELLEGHAYDNSTVNIKGGSYAGINGHDTSTVNIKGGIDTYAFAYDNSTTNILGGSLMYISSFDNSITNISGGVVPDIYAYDSSVFNITGGRIGIDTIRLLDNSTVNFFGADLSLALIGVGHDDWGNYTGYTLFGTLQNGHSIDGVHLYDYDGGYQIGDPNSPNGPNSPVNFFAVTIATPEPGSVVFVLFCSLPAVRMILRRRTK